MLCQQEAAQLRSIIPQIHEADAQLIIIGNGTAQQAQWFLEETGLDTPVYTDPDLHVYRAIGARRGLRSVLHPMVFVRALEAWRKGHRQSGTMGDATQVGGLLIIQPDGTIPFLHRSSYAGDTPTAATILGALNKTRVAAV